jgi:curved DNA-binding protein CbpA
VKSIGRGLLFGSMAPARLDPYQTLEVSPGASEAEIRAAYRRLVQLHHPDHNGGSPEAARRFEEVQEAYAEVRRLRGRPGATGPPPRTTAPDPETDSRLADLERQVREAHERRERARQAAREAAARSRAERPSDEELGYIKTDDSLGKILADARDQLADHLGAATEHPVAQRVADLIDELEGLVDKRPRNRR